MKKVAILQSNYIPWKGYFDIIHDVDEFIFYDDVQYTKNDWRNRNRVKTRHGLLWVTVPVEKSISKTIDEMQIRGNLWQIKHLKTLTQYYSRAKFYHDFKPFLEMVYLERTWTSLSELNQWIIQTISTRFLGMSTLFRNVREFSPKGQKFERLLDLLIQVEADVYVSGPAAKSYILPQMFKKAGIDVVYKDYSAYPEYFQFYQPFEHGVTILDLLFHVGPKSSYYIWGWRND